MGGQNLQAANTRCVQCVCLLRLDWVTAIPPFSFLFFLFFRSFGPQECREKVSRMVRCVGADLSARGSQWMRAVMYLQLHKGDWRVSFTRAEGTVSNTMPEMTALLIC